MCCKGKKSGPMPYKDKEKRYEAIRKSVAKNPVLYKALGKANKRKAHRRGYMIKRLYGITIEQYMEILEAQDKSCAICHKPAGISVTGRPNLYVDHNHTTNVVRGLLCPRCNMFVGFMDEPDFREKFARAEAYVAKNS